MESSDFAVLLGLVKDLDTELDRYLAGSSSPAAAGTRMLEICRQMRAKELDGAMQYWLGTIERHATEIGNPQKASGDGGRMSSSARLLSTQLLMLKDIHNLRILLTNSRSAIANVHGSPTVDENLAGANRPR